MRRGLSAGRVQTVAVRLIVEREGEIKAFQPVGYWPIDAVLETRGGSGEPALFVARFTGIDGERATVPTVGSPAMPDGASARAAVTGAEQARWSVRSVETKERKQNPRAPFTTSKLQQDAAGKLGFSVKRTMGVAQRLYEGVEVGAEGGAEGNQIGLITYMRTDSTRVSPDAVESTRAWLTEKLGQQYVPAKPNEYRSKKDAQDAHEAIRPTHPEMNPDSLRPYLSEEQFKLHRLIWQRFIASQMVPAIWDQTTVEIDAKGDRTYNFRLSGSVLRFDGFLKVYADVDEQEGDSTQKLPKLETGQSLQLASSDALREMTERRRAAKLAEARSKHELRVAEIEARNEEAATEAEKQDIPEFVVPELGELAVRPAVEAVRKFTEPPPRYSEASLVKVLEERGIGRPSTYASIINTIQEREYVQKMGNKRSGGFVPTEIGTVVTDLLIKNFPYIFDTQYTAQLETELDDIEHGKERWTSLLKGFYGHFRQELGEASEHMEDLKRMEIPTDQKCDNCGAPLVMKWGKFGTFYACTAYNKKDKNSCNFTKENFDAKPNLHIEGETEEKEEEYCEACGRVMVLRNGPFGPFMACPGYNEDPPCKSIRRLTQKQQQKPPVPLDENCPKCNSQLVLRNGQYGEFISCSAYPKCKYIKQDTIGMDCPKCDGGEIVQKKSKFGSIFYSCTNYPKCDFTANHKPIPTHCPECNGPYLMEKVLKSGVYLVCPNNRKSAAADEAKKKAPARRKKGAEEPEEAIVCSFSERIGDAPSENAPAAAGTRPVPAPVAVKSAAKKVAAKKTAKAKGTGGTKRVRVAV